MDVSLTWETLQLKRRWFLEYTQIDHMIRIEICFEYALSIRTHCESVRSQPRWTDIDCRVRQVS